MLLVVDISVVLLVAELLHLGLVRGIEVREEAGKEAARARANNVDPHGVRGKHIIRPVVGGLLEDGLDDADGRVDGSTGNIARLLDHVEQSGGDDEGIEGELGGTIVVLDGKDDRSEQEGAEHLSDESVQDDGALRSATLKTVFGTDGNIFSICRAKGGDSGSFLVLIVKLIGKIKQKGDAEASAQKLSGNDHEEVDAVAHLSLSDEHGGGNGRINVTS